MKRIVGLVMVGLVVLLASGCQSLEEQAGKKIAENMLGQALGGDVQMDEDGNVSIKTADGEATIGGGNQRPKTAPEDLPSLPGGKDFSWMGNSDGGWFVYKVTDADFMKTCDDQIALMKGAGWQEKKQSYTYETEDAINKSFYKNGFLGTISCTREEGDISFVLTKGVDESVTEDTSADESEDGEDMDGENEEV